MKFMFKKTLTFNKSLNNWNTQNVGDMKDMFNAASAFNQPLNNWKTGKVINMSSMFKNASAFSDQNLSAWDVTKVTNHGGFMTGAGTGNTEPSW
jgi:surface protein